MENKGWNKNPKGSRRAHIRRCCRIADYIAIDNDTSPLFSYQNVKKKGSRAMLAHHRGGTTIDPVWEVACSTYNSCANWRPKSVWWYKQTTFSNLTTIIETEATKCCPTTSPTSFSKKTRCKLTKVYFMYVIATLNYCYPSHVKRRL